MDFVEGHVIFAGWQLALNMFCLESSLSYLFFQRGVNGVETLGYVLLIFSNYFRASTCEER
jgi:hypothetical protein